jgi:hypothetical protein
VAAGQRFEEVLRADSGHEDYGIVRARYQAIAETQCVGILFDGQLAH